MYTYVCIPMHVYLCMYTYACIPMHVYLCMHTRRHNSSQGSTNTSYLTAPNGAHKSTICRFCEPSFAPCLGSLRMCTQPPLDGSIAADRGNAAVSLNAGG